jgi:hypothetical protein
MNRQLTPDQRAGLSVTGLLLLAFGAALAYFCYRMYGLPVPPMEKFEVYLAGISGVTAFVGLACMYKATDSM